MANRKLSQLTQLTSGNPVDNDRLLAYVPGEVATVNQNKTLSLGNFRTWLSTRIPFLQSGAGAVARTVDAKLKDVVSVKDFGAVGDGVANDTAAINAALSFTYTNLKAVYFPAGTYLYDGGGALGNGNVLYGDGRNATVIKSRLASPTSGYLVRALGYGSGIRNIRFEANTPQTAGSYVWLSGPETFIEDFFMDGDFNGVLMTGNVSRIRHGRFQSGASGAIRIRAEGGDNSQVIDDVLMGAQSPQISSAGIRVRNSSALMITNTSVIQQGYGLLIDPYTATVGSNTVNTDQGSVFSLYANNCFFDNSSQRGILISATGNANVVRCRFANVWASSSTSDGVRISHNSSGLVQGMHFESSHLMLNGGAGLSLGGTGTIKDVTITGGEICNNSHGVYNEGTVDNLKITGATIGAGAGLSGNTNSGITFTPSASTAATNVVIADNVMTGNGFEAITSLPVKASASIYGNVGQDYLSWTPTVSFTTPGDLAVTYAAQSGRWYKIGNLVYATFLISTSSFTWTTSSGSFVIGGLPLSQSASVQLAQGSIELQGVTVGAGYTHYTLANGAGSTQLRLRASGSGLSITELGTAQVPTGSSIILRGSIVYLA